MPGGKIMILGRPTMMGEGAPTPEEFYKRRGFETVHTMDVSPYQGASHIHDLNDPLPPELVGQYDMVTTAGTLEHIFDVANALKAVASMVKVGGIVACGAPANNWMEHGFYQISPTLKFDYFNVNGFEFGNSTGIFTDPGIRLHRSVPLYPGEVQKWNRPRYRLVHSLWAHKLANSTVDRVPIQSIYLEKHSGERRRYRFRALEPREARDGVLSPPPMHRSALSDFKPQDGRWMAPFFDPAYPASTEKQPFRSTALVYEDGVLLPWIVSAPAMVRERPGSFFHAARFVHFSTTDGTDPRSNGHLYEIAFPDLSNWLK